MSVKAKRIAKKAAKTGVWAISDIIFLVLKMMGTVLLIAITTGILFSCIFLIYVRANLTSGLDVNPTDFTMSKSSVICYIDPVTEREEELVTLQSTEFRLMVEYKDIPEHLIDALVAIEDHRFFRHSGVDWYRTAGAFMNMFLGMKDTFGGSTITQQLIKNLTNEDDVTVQRKLMEIFRAIEYEKHSTKEDILELYLNLVYFGHGCYGIGAAADYYFGKEVPQLTLAESAAIIGITNNPSMYSPYANKKANKSRQEDILFRMHELGFIATEQEFRKAVDEPLNFKRGDNYEFEQVIYTWFEEAVINDVIQDIIKEKGYNEAYARRLLFTGGYRIIATIDPDIQQVVDDVYTDVESLPVITGSSAQAQSGVVIADPHTGEIKALSGGVGPKTRNLLLNRATMTQRPPGSSLKPLAAYAPAMDRGILTPTTFYEDSADVTLSGTTWMPKNANRDYRDGGIVDVRTAILLSLNTTPAIVVDQLTPKVSYNFLKDSLGFNLHPADEDYAPLAAGQLTNGATVREMASGFTIFPNYGMRVELHTYRAVYDAYGMLYLDNGTAANRAISEEAAYWMTEMLYSAVMYGTGSEANLGTMPTAGKTGTSTNSEDRWFVGFTPYYIAAVWTGYDMPTNMRVTGNPAAQIWKRLMAPIHEGLEPTQFYPFDSSYYYLRPVPGVSTIEYTVRCQDADGTVLQEDSSGSIPGREVTKQAPEIEGYKLVSEPELTITISVNPARNVLMFVYEPDETEDAEEPGGAEEPDDENPGDTDNPYIVDNPYWPFSPFGTYPPYGPGNPFSPDNPYGPDDSYGPYNPYDPYLLDDTDTAFDPFAPGDNTPPEDWVPPPDPGDTPIE